MYYGPKIAVFVGFRGYLPSLFLGGALEDLSSAKSQPHAVSAPSHFYHDAQLMTVNRFNITIDHATSHSSDHSSLSDEEDSSGTGVEVSPPSATASHDYHDPYDVGGPWDHLSYPDELKPSDSASRPRTSHYHHATVDSGRARSTRHQSARRRATQEREPLAHRSRHHHTPHPIPEPESEDSSEDYLEYPPGPPERRFWPPIAPVPPGGYSHSTSSGPSYGSYQHGNTAHGPLHLHAPPPGVPSNQLVQFGPMSHMGLMGHMNHYGVPGPYPYGPGFPGSGHPMPPAYFSNSERHHSPPPHHHQRPRSHSGGQRDAESPPPTLAHPVPSRLNSHFPGAPFIAPDMVPFHPHSGYFHYGQHYGFPPEMMPPRNRKKRKRHLHHRRQVLLSQTPRTKQSHDLKNSSLTREWSEKPGKQLRKRLSKKLPAIKQLLRRVPLLRRKLRKRQLQKQQQLPKRKPRQKRRNSRRKRKLKRKG
ncbi:hypothetical protein CISG_09668 [Coccidioides immitis RMSCC 3703]|uniref:Uncharacterized protein n=1 Tax=Coccidioides immitis RMSCC 3703 TaxID=454286 RepID=A0A0J8QLL0_COCIT|nr:hypothetical protein CISG_09668 [Coccidioides immitis RMSCC 3703]